MAGTQGLPSAFCCLHGGWACTGTDIAFRSVEGSDASPGAGLPGPPAAVTGSAGGGRGRRGSAFQPPATAASRRGSVTGAAPGGGPGSALSSPAYLDTAADGGDWDAVTPAGPAAAGVKLGDSTAAALFVTDAPVFRLSFPGAAAPVEGLSAPPPLPAPYYHVAVWPGAGGIPGLGGATGLAGDAALGTVAVPHPPPPAPLDRLESEDSPMPEPDSGAGRAPALAGVTHALVVSRGKSPPPSPRESMDEGPCVCAGAVCGWLSFGDGAPCQPPPPPPRCVRTPAWARRLSRAHTRRAYVLMLAGRFGRGSHARVARPVTPHAISPGGG
jgi:hypothetical protein